MYRQRKEGWEKHLDFFILDIVFLEIALYISYMLRHGLTSIPISYHRLGIVILLLSLCFGLSFKSYRDVLKRGYYQEFKQTVIHVTLVCGMNMIIVFLMKEYDYSRAVLLLQWGLGILFCYTGRCIWKKAVCKKLVRAQGDRRVLIITTHDLAEDAVERLNRPEVKDYVVTAVVYTDIPPVPQKSVKGIPVLGSIQDEMEWLRDEIIDEIYIYLKAEEQLPQKYLDLFVQAGMTVHIDLHIPMQEEEHAYVHSFFGNMVLTTGMKFITPLEAVLKRLLDIWGALVGLLLTAVVCIVIVPAIKLADPGPAFYSQTRVGRNGRRFKIYKFRSMYMGADQRLKELQAQNEMQGLMFKMENDPRIIKGIGHFIRRTSIDELPQFWNVLKGDMSLVGTRPPTENEYVLYEAHHLKRTSIKPGITGMWQTSGRNDITDFEEVVRLDTKYITNWSIGLDIKLLVKTVLVVLKAEGSR